MHTAAHNTHRCQLVRARLDAVPAAYHLTRAPRLPSNRMGRRGERTDGRYLADDAISTPALSCCPPSRPHTFHAKCCVMPCYMSHSHLGHGKSPPGIRIA